MSKRYLIIQKNTIILMYEPMSEKFCHTEFMIIKNFLILKNLNHDLISVLYIHLVLHMSISPFTKINNLKT